MTIREFIELQQKIYDLDKNTYNKIKTKISRELSKIEAWTTEQEPTTRKTAKTKSIELTEEVLAELKEKMKPYFLKLSKFQPEDIEFERQLNEIRAYNLTSDFKKSNRDNPEIYEIPSYKKMEVMIEALFNLHFDLNEEEWKEDYSFYKNFESDPEVLPTEGMAFTTAKLRDPYKHYVTKKRQHKDSTRKKYDIMADNKSVQIILRTTKEEKEKITKKAKDKGLSVNEYIKQKLLNHKNSNDSSNDINDSKDDSTSAIIEILREQLKTKDIQIANLQQIIYNRDTKLIEHKKWWQFWK